MLARLSTLARAALAATAIAVATVPAQTPAWTQAQLSGLTQRDKAIGARGYEEIVREFGGRVEGPLADYVRSVGLRVALESVPGSRPSDWTITVLDSPVPNAMATPGGYLYITRGLLAMINSEAELASVLGHEAGHVAARHADKRQSRATIGGIASIAAAVLTGSSEIGQLANLGASAWVSGFSRGQENEADTLGLRYMMAAGYDPRAAASMLQALERVATVEGRPSFERGGLASIFSTHPVTAERVQRVARQAAQAGRTGVVNREAYLSAIDGMTFGDAPEQGIVSGPSFRHASLRLGFDAPPGFTLQNSPQAVAGRGRDGSQFIFQGVAAPRGQRLDSIAEQVWRQMTNNRVPPVRGGFREVNNVDAFLSDARLASARGQVDVGVHVFRTDPDSVWLIRTVAPAGRGGQFDSLLQSFRRLGPAEVERARAGRRIDVVTVRAGDTPASLAQRMSPPYNRVQSLLALNGIPDRPLQPGERLKLIVG